MAPQSGLAVAIQMDPIDSVDIDADSTFVMAMEAQERGHALWYYPPHHMSFHHGRVYAKAINPGQRESCMAGGPSPVGRINESALSA